MASMRQQVVVTRVLIVLGLVISVLTFTNVINPAIASSGYSSSSAASSDTNHSFADSSRQRTSSRVCEHGHSLMMPGLTEPGQWLYNVVEDMLRININVVSFDTFKIVTSIFPFVLIGRMVDGRLQSCFYDRKHHKNINQLNDACRLFAKHSLIYPVFLAGALSVSAHDEDVKATSRMFIKGLPFVLFVSDAIKQFDVYLVGDSCLRPWNENFSCKKRSRGGFPSGHLASVSYATVLYGVRFGPKWAVPLGALTAAVGLSFLNCNRHYLSQLFAGIGLGAIFGVAASHQVDFRLGKMRETRLQTGLDVDSQGAPALKVALSF